MLLTWDRFVRERGPEDVAGDWTVTATDMQTAISIAELSFLSTLDLTRRILTSDDARQKRVVLDAVGTDWTSQAVVFQDCGLLRKRAIEGLETLREEGLIERQKISNIVYWRRSRSTVEEDAQQDAREVGNVLGFSRKDDNADGDADEAGEEEVV